MTVAGTAAEVVADRPLAVDRIPLVCDPGVVLAELTLRRPVTDEQLLEGLAPTFAGVRLDASDGEDPRRRRIVRLAADLMRAATFGAGDGFEWARVVPLSVRLGPPADDLPTLDLERGVVYHARFLSRLWRAFDRGALREDVEGWLKDMHVEPIAITCLERGRRYPAWPNTTLSLWVGIVRWLGTPAGSGRAVTTTLDPITFESLVPVETEG